jgi:nitrite reductase/ring-hydroxylating ferredoxin subunit
LSEAPAPAPAPDAGQAWTALCSRSGELAVGMERFQEIALDWQRLPHVHGRNVRSIVCLDCGPGGWRARLTAADGATWEAELVLDRASRSCSIRFWQNRGTGLLARVILDPQPRDQTLVLVTLFATDPPTPDSPEQWLEVVDDIWASDAAMMVERQRQIDRRVDRAGADRQRDLGLREGLTLPLAFELGGREFLLAEADGRLVAFPRRCPHQLGPLDQALVGRVLTCPWHGYQFDAVTGENMGGGVCRLTGMPKVICVGGRVIVNATH